MISLGNSDLSPCAQAYLLVLSRSIEHVHQEPDVGDIRGVGRVYIHVSE